MEKGCKYPLVIILICLLQTACTENPQDPRNVTVIPGPSSLEVSWQAPNVNDSLESYRVRIYPLDQENKRRVRWLPATEDRRLKVTCLEPDEWYVQVFSRFDKQSNISDGSSQIVKAITLPADKNFLSGLWEQRLYVSLGAGVTAGVFLIVIACLWCCCGRCNGRRKTLRLDKTISKNEEKKRARKESCLPSARELRDRERRRNSYERYSENPCEPSTYRPSRTESPLTSSFPGVQAPNCPSTRYLSINNQGVEDDLDDDGLDYQNVSGVSTSGDSYANHPFCHQRPSEDTPIYGNCHF